VAHTAAGESVTVHSSWRGIISGALGAGMVAAAGTYGVLQVGFRVIPGTLFVIGWILVLAMALDYPIASTFTSSGVTRHMALRRQQFEWDEDLQLSRTRPTLVRIDRRLEHGALALVKGRRRYLLVDRLESADEFDTLVTIVEAEDADNGASMLPRPGPKVPPTWLYRRACWRPASATE
jgi:hypothetical protein